MPARSSGNGQDKENAPIVRCAANWQALRRRRQPDEPNLGEEGAQALALLRLTGGSARRQEQSGFGHPRSGRRCRSARHGRHRQTVLKRRASQTDIRDLIDRVVIGRTTIQIRLSEVAEAEAGARTLTAPLVAALALSQARDHPGRNRREHECPPDARQRARNPDRSSWRRPSLARRTSVRSAPDFGVAGFARGQD